jgi:hypothetical protein
VRRRGHAENGILQIDEDECGLLGVELEFCHGFLFIEDILKSRRASISLDLEYEDSLAFVKSRSRRTTVGMNLRAVITSPHPQRTSN